jgi:hypothetical protein
MHCHWLQANENPVKSSMFAYMRQILQGFHQTGQDDLFDAELIV